MPRLSSGTCKIIGLLILLPLLLLMIVGVILLGLYLSEKMDNGMRIQRLKALATIASLYTSTPTPSFSMFYTVVADQFLYCIDFERVLTGPSSVLL